MMEATGETHMSADLHGNAQETALAVDHARPEPGRETSANRAWAPIRSLGDRHRGRIAVHLLALSEHDRYLRFGYAATDTQISKYIDALDFERDEIFGIFNRRLEVAAMAHLAHRTLQEADLLPAVSEFGVSVLPRARGRGYGCRLFERAMLHARNRGVNTLFIHALSENIPMLKIARNAGAVIERSGSESEAWIELPPDTVGSHVAQLLEGQVAEIDYRLKVHARQVSRPVEAVCGVNTHAEHGGLDTP